MEDGRAYLAKHEVEEKLRAAVAQILRERPDNPVKALANMLSPAKAEAKPIMHRQSSSVTRIPERVVKLFEHCDSDGDGALDLAEIQGGIAKELEPAGLREDAKTLLPGLFEAACKQLGTDKVNKEKFVRLYALVLYAHFDTNSNGMLDADECGAAMSFLNHGQHEEGEDSVKVAVPNAFPNGVDFKTFWDMFKANVR